MVVVPSVGGCVGGSGDASVLWCMLVIVVVAVVLALGGYVVVVVLA